MKTPAEGRRAVGILSFVVSQQATHSVAVLLGLSKLGMSDRLWGHVC